MNNQKCMKAILETIFICCDLDIDITVPEAEILSQEMIVLGIRAYYKRKEYVDKRYKQRLLSFAIGKRKFISKVEQVV